jgi:hypothetical protein
MEIRERIMNVIKGYLNENYIGERGELQDLSQDDINEILRGYIECALWTEEERLRDEYRGYDFEDDDDDDDEDNDEIEKMIRLQNKFQSKNFMVFASDDIDIDSKISAYEDIKKFIKSCGDEAIDEAIDENGLFQLGMDIWFARNHHGSGFFDRNYDNEEILTRCAQNLKEKYLFIGDDNKLYFE